MSLGQLSTAPTNAEEVTWLAAANQDEHVKVAAAIASSSKYQNQNLLVRPLDPIPIGNQKALEDWLNNHYDMHNAVNAVLEIDGSDISTVDFNNKDQLAAWTLLHYSEHSQWQQILGTT
jgi:hypothetical protein